MVVERYSTTCSLVVAALLASSVASSAAVSTDASISHPTAVVWAESARFAPIAEQVADELRRLLGPDAGSRIAVDVRPDGALLDRLDTVGPETLPIVVGPSPGALADLDRRGDPGPPMVLVDPVGWLPGTASRAARLGPRVEHDVRALRGLLGALDEIGSSAPIAVAIDPWLAPAWPTIESVASDLGLRAHAVSPTPDAVAAIGASAVYWPPGAVEPTPAQWAAFAERGLLTFSARRSDVGRGALAARTAPVDARLARLAALDALALLRGLPAAADAPRVAVSTDRLALDLDVAAALGWTLPWRLRLDAETVGEGAAAGSLLDLDAVRREVVEANLDVRARSLATAASEQDVERALAALRPRLSVRAEAVTIDDETAIAAFGSRPERSASVLGEASWLLFSEDARAVIDSERRIQAARALELRQVELDVALDGGLRWIDIALARSIEAVERDQLDAARADLDTARSRRGVGAGGRADVARLEARVAAARRALVDAFGERRRGETVLARLLSRPLDVAIVPQIEDPPISARLGHAIESRAAFAELGRHALVSAIDQAPEIAAADEIVAARERELIAARRAFVLPKARAAAAIQSRVVEDGAGVGSPALFGDGGNFPAAPDTSWSFRLGVEWPLITGGERTARRARAELDVETARVLRQRAEQAVEERVRLALIALDTAHAAAVEARAAAAAAKDAADVVAAGYARGTETLTALLTARSEERVARQQQAVADFGVLARWLGLQRAIGRFLDTAAEAAWLDQLETHLRIDSETDTDVDDPNDAASTADRDAENTP